MTTEKKARWIAGTLTGLLLLAMVTGFYQYKQGQGYKSEAETALLRQDSILAVKQMLDKELADTRIELGNAKGRNAELDEMLLAKETSLKDKQTEIDRLMAQNATVQSLRNQLTLLKSERETMNQQIQALLAENQTLSAENQRLRNNIITLETDKVTLQEQLAAADRTGNRAHNFRVDMMRNNGKVTAKAKRTRDIKVSFDMPMNNSEETTGSKEVYLVIVGPDGKAIRNDAATSVILTSGTVIDPIKTKKVEMKDNPQTVVMDVSLDNKVKSGGVYKVQVYTMDGMIGSSQIKMN